MEDCSHIQIFAICYLASALSAVCTYSYSTLYSETHSFSYRKVAVYSLYFGTAGLLACMIGFDMLGGKKAWYRAVGLAGGIGIGAIKADIWIAKLADMLPDSKKQ